MTGMRRPLLRASLALVATLAFALVGCGGDSGAAALPATPDLGSPASPTATGTAERRSTDAAFPTGPAVLVRADEPLPEGRVPSTGAHLPANGKPTLVMVDAIF